MQRRHILGWMALSGTVPVLAQSFPNKPIKIIVPAPPGGTADIFARALAQRMQAAMNNPVIVEYKAGAATNIGTDYVAKAAPDGYTVLINGITLATNPALFAKLPFNPATDLTPIIEVASMVNVITVHPSLPVNTLAELIDLARRSPGKINHGSPGIGSSGHLAGELLAYRSGVQLTHIAYQGLAPATNDHVGGTLPLGFVNLPVALQFVRAGKLKALAVTSLKRTPQLPDVPTVNEALGLKDFELNGWFGLMAPARTPADVVARLQAEADKALRDPAFMEIVKTAGGEAVGGSSADFDARIRRDRERLGEVIRLARIKAE
jgi:tripartite-type tricarboxylate transporter receptor subunit TctC